MYKDLGITKIQVVHSCVLHLHINLHSCSQQHLANWYPLAEERDDPIQDKTLGFEKIPWDIIAHSKQMALALLGPF